MVAIKAALLATSLVSFVSGVPTVGRRDSSINEPAVSAPNGVLLTASADVPAATPYSSSSGSYGSSDSGSSWGSDSSDSSSYDSGSYDSGSYGSSYSGSSDCGQYGCDAASSVMDDSSTMTDDASTAVWDSASTMMDDVTSTALAYTTVATSTWAAASSAATYGSGSSSWGDSGYNSCVQQCVASYGAPPSMYTPPPSSTTDSSDGSDSDSTDSASGSAATHTVIVAPAQGILRFVPFTLNASVGDTVRFYWGANMHTVTKSSELEICNKTSDNPFTSGVQNQSFVFDQVVNDTNPLFFYCGVPTHCEKGMFGIINPPNAAGSASSVGSMMVSWAESNPDIAAMLSYTNNQTMSVSAAMDWGSEMDVSSMPSSAYPYIAANVMYTRLAMAANPSAIQNGVLVPSSTLVVPMDISALATPSNSTTSTPSTPVNAASSSPASSDTTSAASSTPTSAGVKSIPSSVAVAVVALIATFFAL